MNLFFVTSYDLEGQQFNGYQLHKALIDQGHTSHMAVASCRSDDPNIKSLCSPLTRRVNESASKIEQKLSLYSLLPVSGFSLYLNPWYRNADIVHLQLLHAMPFFSLLNLPLMSRQHKVVWTIHDPWLTTGHCVHPLDCNKWMSGCESCPDLPRLFPITRDTSAFTWKLKKWIMQHSNITLVVSSQWMHEHVKQSPILSHLPCHLIPFGLDTTVFRPKDKVKSKQIFGIPGNAKVLLFRNAPHYMVKGSHHVVKALELLRFSDDPICLITLDSHGGLETLRDKYTIIELGWIDNQNKIADALNAADIFLMPSLAETFGMMSIESLACGTPVIVFEGTSLPGVLHAPYGGFAVPANDHVALANAVEKLLKDDELYHSQRSYGLKLVADNYTTELYIERHMELYHSLLR